MSGIRDGSAGPGNRQYYENEDAPVQQDNPLEVYIQREALIEILEAQMSTIAMNRATRCETLEEDAYAGALLAEREGFVRWLRAQTEQKHILCGLYVMSELEDAEDVPGSERTDFGGRMLM